MNDLVKQETKPGVIAESVITQHLVVAGKTPAEVAMAQGSLMEWFKVKVAEEQQELKDLQANLQHAVDGKLATKPWTGRIKKQQARVVYYEKALAALEAGYWIVPNFDLDVYAVRTTRETPKPEHTEARYGTPSMTLVAPSGATVGDGKYVSPSPMTETGREVRSDKDGKEYQVQTADAVGFALPDFPFAFAKPQILSAANAAMALGIFDEVGVMPLSRKGDPVIAGVVCCVDGSKKWAQKRMTFLISWFVDTRQL